MFILRLRDDTEAKVFAVAPDRADVAGTGGRKFHTAYSSLPGPFVDPARGIPKAFAHQIFNRGCGRAGILPGLRVDISLIHDQAHHVQRDAVVCLRQFQRRDVQGAAGRGRRRAFGGQGRGPAVRFRRKQGRAEADGGGQRQDETGGGRPFCREKPRFWEKFSASSIYRSSTSPIQRDRRVFFIVQSLRFQMLPEAYPQAPQA